MLKVLFVLLLAAVLADGGAGVPARASAMNIPVLIELFTSEGCSSCPPADALLQRLDAQPVPGAQLIVLSEHVDYWNHIGWKDPYSSHFFSERQNTYSLRFGGDTVYTPQMVVDGSAQFVGSDSREAQHAIEKARDREKVSVVATNISLPTPGVLNAHLEVGPLAESLKSRSAAVFVAVALNHAESQVLRGENEGRHLQHVAVAQSITKVGTVSKAKGLIQDASVKLNAGADPANLRLVVFVQEEGSGRVLGATLQQVKR